ncbi:hypothetical protein T492DRAFT_844111 [Pavlovales sp. CCMP2436]|nr:hypothetical protein T492DRAFT_844111 [Pavlovales sp. CCMP2436]
MLILGGAASAVPLTYEVTGFHRQLLLLLLSLFILKALGGAAAAGPPTYEVKGFHRQLDCAELVRSARESEDRSAAGGGGGGGGAGMFGRVAQKAWIINLQPIIPAPPPNA